jgi:hypothetical protein
VPIIPAIGMLRQESSEFKISLGYIVKTQSQRKNKEINKNRTQRVYFYNKAEFSSHFPDYFKSFSKGLLY